MVWGFACHGLFYAVAQRRYIGCAGSAEQEIALRHTGLVAGGAGTAILRCEHASALGCLGYVAAFARTPGSGHPAVDLSVVEIAATARDVLVRYTVRRDEFAAAAVLIRHIVESHSGPIESSVSTEPVGTPSSGVGIVEGWHGTIVHRAEIDATNRITPVPESLTRPGSTGPRCPWRWPTRSSPTWPPLISLRVVLSMAAMWSAPKACRRPRAYAVNPTPIPNALPPKLSRTGLDDRKQGEPADEMQRDDHRQHEPRRPHLGCVNVACHPKRAGHLRSLHHQPRRGSLAACKHVMQKTSADHELVASDLQELRSGFASDY